MPREAPVNTMVFCSAEDRIICGGTPGKGQSTVVSSVDPAWNRRSWSGSACSYGSSQRVASAVLPTLRDLQDPGQSHRITVQGLKSLTWINAELILERPARMECRCSDIRVT